MTQRGSHPLQERWLTGVQIDFVGERPKTKLGLTIAVDEELSSCKIEEKDDVQWKGKLPFSETSICSVKLYKKTLLKIPKLFAFVETPLARDTDSSAEISVQDEKNKVIIKLIFSEFPASRQQEGSQSAASTNDTVDISTEKSHGSDDIAAKAQSTREGLDSAKAAADGQKAVVDKLGKVWSVIKGIKKVGEAVGDIHPAIGAAASALGWLIKVCEKQKDCCDEAKKLMKELDLFLAIEKYIEELKDREETRLAVERMLELIAQISDCVREHAYKRGLGKFLPGEYKETLEDFTEEFTSAKESFDRSIHLEILRIARGIEQAIWLQKFEAVAKAYYKSGLEDTCLPGTRRDLVDVYMRWMHGSGPEAELAWLFGFAGTGKTCMANTIAQAVHDSGFGLSCFFFKRDDPELSRPERVFPTLASHFAERYPSFGGALLEIPRHDHLEVTQGNISKQFNLLFAKPLAKTADPFRPHIIVIDALDECGTPKEQEVLAGYLLKLAEAAPWIKVLVTSREEPGIRKVFQSSPACFAKDLAVEAQADADIRQYIESKLGELGLQLRDEQIAQLVRQAAGLFIWCTTLVSYLNDSIDAEDDLKPFLKEGPHNSHDSHQKLYELYDKIITSAVKNQKHMPFLRTVLGVVCVAATLRPLPISHIAHFLQSHTGYKSRSEIAVGNVIRPLHAVLYEDTRSRDAVRVHHTSFLDFLHNKLEREEGWERPKEVHAFMSRSCLATMDKELKFNICKLGGAPVPNKDIPDLGASITDLISQELQYAVEFWLDHLSRSGSLTDDDLSVVKTLLLTPKALFWLEVMSLRDLVGRSVDILRRSSVFFQAYPDLSATVLDLEKLVSSFSEAFESTPHIYLSALPWLPQKSRTYASAATSFRHLPLISGKDDDWRASIWTKSIGTEVYTVAFSPDGGRIVSGSVDGTVRVWNSHTGAPVGERLRGHEDYVQSVAFSPDGCRIVSGSWDNTIRVWDAHTGAPVGEPLRGHESAVWSVAFSPDGGRIVSGSRDNTIRVWDAHTGAPVGEPLRGHKSAVWSVAFSPDGYRIVSGSEDKTIRVWDAHTGAPVGEPLRGHEDGVSSVAFSPDGCRIVSGSWDNTIRVWDAHTGAPVGEPLRGHKSAVCSVAFSPDGCRIVSGSSDQTIRVWDAHTGAPVGEPLRGHESAVRSVAFSPDGCRIVSGSWDNTIRVWDAHTGAPVGEPLRGHEGAAWSVAFSPDGCRIVSGSRDNTIRVWDAHTGAPVGEPLRGHKGAVWSVAFSSDGCRIVSGSEDKTIRVWDAHTGAPVCEPLRGHKRTVWSVAFSRDGCRIVSGSSDNTIRVWDVHTGAPVGEPLRGHESAVLSVAFSPDGCRIVSGSWDNTIRVWDAHMGLDTAEMHDDADAEASSAHSYHDRWITCRLRMEETDAWVRDGEMLLLWIPYRYRHLYRTATVLLIGTGGGRAPDVDPAKLYAYSGARWTDIYVRGVEK